MTHLKYGNKITIDGQSLTTDQVAFVAFHSGEEVKVDISTAAKEKMQRSRLS